MVAQRDSATPEAGDPATQDDGLPPLEIDDSTPPEVMELSEAWERGEQIDQDGEGGETEEQGDGGGAEAEAPATGEVEPPEAEQKSQEPPEPEPEKPPPKIQDTPEWRRLQSSLDSQRIAAIKRAEEAEKRLQQFNLETEVEAALRREEARLEPTVGAEEARRVARDPSRVREVRESIEARAETEALRQQAQAGIAAQKSTALDGWIAQLQTAYSLSTDDVEQLRGVARHGVALDGDAYVEFGETLGGMAKRLGTVQKSRQEAERKRRERVPNGTPETALETGVSTAHAPPDDEAIAQSAEWKPASEWTEREQEVMRRYR